MVLHAEYELLDYVPIFPGVPDELYLRNAESIAPRRIPTGAIKRFEFLVDPSPAWQEQIEAAAQKRKGEGSSIELKWFHDIMRDPKQHGDLFKPQRF